MLLLANIYLNKLSNLLGDDRKIVEMLIFDGHKVSKSDDGKYVFVYKSNQNLVAYVFSKYKYTTEEAIRLLNESCSDSIKTESINDIRTESDSPKSKPD